MKTALLAAVALLALAGSAHAQRFSRVSGGSLANLCTNRDPKQVEACEAYIDGISDTASFYQRLRPLDGSNGPALPAYICVPPATTGIQLRQLVVSWLGAHQDQSGREGGGVVLRALSDTYPCAGQPKG